MVQLDEQIQSKFWKSYPRNLDISGLPAEDLGSLVTCVSETLVISTVQGDLAQVLSRVQCDKLHLYDLSLDTDHTLHLLAAMVRGLQVLHLGVGVAVDMATLAQYDGRGGCGEVRLTGRSTRD